MKRNIDEYSLKQLIPLSNNISAMILEKPGASNTTAFDAVSASRHGVWKAG